MTTDDPIDAQPIYSTAHPDEVHYRIPPGQFLALNNTKKDYNFPVDIKDPGDTKSAGYKCPRCNFMVRRTKPGFRLSYSCRCFSMNFHESERHGPPDDIEWLKVIKSVQARDDEKNN
jgi:hypothetical protein